MILQGHDVSVYRDGKPRASGDDPMTRRLDDDEKG